MLKFGKKGKMRAVLREGGLDAHTKLSSKKYLKNTKTTIFVCIFMIRYPVAAKESREKTERERWREGL